MVPFVASVRARVLPLLAALTVGLALPAVAVAQTPKLPGVTEDPPPWPGGENGEPQGGSQPAREDPDTSADGIARPTVGQLPSTGSEPLLLGLSGAALALLGTGLRLRTLDADLF